MSLLTPLGLLGLLGIIALIIIYIIKPNYQNKFISSTYIWKMSLKYKRKKIPISKLRNIIIFICQVAILAAATFILAQPFINTNESDVAGDEIIIIDVSASMHTQVNQEMRIERAADKALADAIDALEKGKTVSVIVASDEAYFLVQQASKEQSELVYDAFDSITKAPEDIYTYGSPDIDGAMTLAEQITSYAVNASVTLYTDTTYIDKGDVKVVNVNDTKEWNAAILDVRATVVENYYRIEIDVASYAADARISVNCEIFDYNDTEITYEIEADAYCSDDKITTIVLAKKSEDMTEEEAELITEEIALTSFEHIYVSISEYDSLSYDNQFYLYGGEKPVLRVQYYSSLPNNFFPTALLVLQDVLKDSWALDITEVPYGVADNQLATEGFDIYIFEHTTPSTIPSDGVVILLDPSKLPAEAGVRFGDTIPASEELFLSPGDPHTIMSNLDPTRISVTQFTSIESSDGYLPVACYEDYPLIMVKEEVDQKIILMPFSLHYSNLAMLPEFPLLLNNIINYFFPVTIDEFVFDTGDVVSLNARADVLNVTGPDIQLSLESFPAEVLLSAPGTYTMTQSDMSGDTVIESIYVKIPAVESNISLEEDTLTNPYFFEESELNIIDLLFYFALAVVALLFIEWWLKSREQI